MQHLARRALLVIGLGVGLGCEGTSVPAMGPPAAPPAPEIKDPATGRWETRAPVPLPRYYVGAAAARNKIFVVGGFNQGAELQAVSVYDVASDTWSETAPLPTRYRMPNAIAVGDRLFVLSGFQNPACVEYDFAANAWMARAPLPLANGRAGAALGVYKDKVILAGGVTPGMSDNGLNTGRRQAEVMQYDPAMDTWQRIGETPVEIGYAISGVIGNEFWLVGGSTNVSRIPDSLVLNLDTNTWSSGPPVPKSISSAAGGVLGGYIYVTGGIATSQGTISTDTMVLDPRAKVWSSAAPLPTGRFGMSAAVLGNKLYVPTGITQQGANAMAFAPVGAMEVFAVP